MTVNLREIPLDKVTLRTEPIHDEDVDNSLARSKHDWRIPNNQIKNACPNKCQKIEAAGFLRDDQQKKFIRTQSGCETLENKCLESSLSSAIGSNLENGKLF